MDNPALQLVWADEQFRNSLCLYKSGEFASALTLAGAADEIYASTLAARGLRPALADTVEFAAQIGWIKDRASYRDYLNRPRNATKHLFEAGRKVPNDLEGPAAEMLQRTHINFRRLHGDFPDWPEFYEFIFQPGGRAASAFQFSPEGKDSGSRI